MLESMKLGWRVRLGADRGKRWFCFLAAVFFAVGILGDLPLEEAGSPADHPCYAGEGTARAALPAEGGRTEPPGLWEDKAAAAALPDGMAWEITACKMLRGMDDFQIAADAGGGGQNGYQKPGSVSALLPDEEDGRLFCSGRQGRRLWTGEKKIRLFCIVKFIHRTDGKKKSCFA